MIATILVVLILLVVFVFFVCQVVNFWRTSFEKSVRGMVLLSLVVVAAMLNWTLALTDLLPDHEVSRQPAGKLVAIQLGRGTNALVETDRAYYAIRGTLTAHKGDGLFLRTMRSQFLGKRTIYLCSEQDCSALANK